MQFLRAKRATTEEDKDVTGDIDLFRRRSTEYLTFIEKLRAKLTQPSEKKYGPIRLTKADNGITKVILKSGSTTVPFIFRNSDLYIVGFVLGSGPTAVFWADHAVFEKLSSRLVGKKLPASHEWRTVLGDVTVKTLSVTLIYNNISQQNGVGHTMVPINRMGSSLAELANIRDDGNTVAVVGQHIIPFVVAFSEAIRFKVISKVVQKVFPKPGGELDMSTNVVELTGVGHPDVRRTSEYDISWLVRHWGQLSDRVKSCYNNESKRPFKHCGEDLGLDANQLNELVTVALASSFTPRTKRDAPNWLNLQIPLEKHAGAMPNLLESSTSANQPAIVNRFELAGALQLISFGILYLSGQQLKSTEYERAMTSREAQAIAADLVAKINCVAKLDSDFDEDMRMQRELYAGLMGEADMEQLMLGMVERKLQQIDVEEAVEKINFELAKEYKVEMAEGSDFAEQTCF